jgi:hypothetical protein
VDLDDLAVADGSVDMLTVDHDAVPDCGNHGLPLSRPGSPTFAGPVGRRQR